MDRRTVALGVVAAGAVAAAVSVTVFRGHGGPSREHRAVASYIEDVDTIQQELRASLTRTLTAYREFSAADVTPAEQRRLSQAERTMRTVRRRVVALEAPPQAERLHALLVRLISQEVTVAHELARLGAFLPPFNASLAQARIASTKLARGLGAAKPPTPHRIHGTQRQVRAARAAFNAASRRAASDQAAAVEAYDAALARVLARMRRLDPPLVMAPAFSTQLRTFELTRTNGAALAAELRKTERSNVALAARRFTVATRTAGSVAAQKAEIRAIRAYDRRVSAIGDLQGELQTELARLQRVVG